MLAAICEVRAIKQPISRFDIFHDSFPRCPLQSVIILDPVFQVPAVLEEGEQIIEPRGRVPFRALYFPERTLQPFELRLPRGHA